MNELTTFSHFGMIGDLIYSLHFCLQIAQYYNQEKFNFHIQTDVPFEPSICEKSSRGGRHVFFTKQEGQFIKPLLEAQPYINQVTIGPTIPEGATNLSNFRQLPLNLGAGDIREWYYQLIANFLPKEFWKKILFINPNPKFKDKVLFTLSERYNNCFVDFNDLKPYKDKLVFIGTEKEYNIFTKNYFEMEFAGRFNNLLQIGEVIAGSKAYIANPTGLFSIAEGLKMPRLLIGSQFMKIDDQILFGPKNILCLGGLHTTATNKSNFKNNIELLFEYV